MTRNPRRIGRYRYGARNASSKLDEPMVRAIRASDEPYPVLAQRYGVSTVTVCHVRKRNTWRHVA